MKVHQESINVGTKKLNDFVKITEDIQKVVDKSKINKGIAFANSLHNTAAVIIQEDDPTIFKDTSNLFERMLPLDGKYEHNHEGNENATAHQKENLLGNSISIPVRDGKLALGAWQDVFLLEFFEPRQREVVVTILGD